MAILKYRVVNIISKDSWWLILKDKDPSELGFEKTNNMIKQTKDSLSFSDIMKMKLGI